MATIEPTQNDVSTELGVGPTHLCTAGVRHLQVRLANDECSPHLAEQVLHILLGTLIRPDHREKPICLWYSIQSIDTVWVI